MSQGEIFLTDRLKDCSWSLAHRQSTPFGRQTGQVVTYGQPYWMASFRYENLSETALRTLSAWLARRQGSRVTFTAYRPTRRYPGSGLTSNGSIYISAISTADSTMTINNLGSNAMLPGDMVSYYTAALGYYCGEVVSVGSLSAGVQTVTMSQAPGTLHASLSAPRVVEALAEFQIEGQAQISEPHDRRYSVQFAARQVERA